jgi:glycosyltransferase involved in cell wall biosynthesis
MGIKIVWTVHNLADHDSDSDGYEDMMHRYLAKLCDAIFVHCKSALGHIAKRFTIGSKTLSKAVVIPHGNYHNCYDNTYKPQAAKQELGLSTDSFVFGFFGNIRKYKGLELLLENFHRLPEKNIRLVVAGKPIDQSFADLLKAAEDRDSRVLIYPKFIESSEVQLFLNAIDVIVAPFQQVLTSGSLMLAITFGKPVIAPKAGCILDIFQKDDLFLYDPADDKGLSNALKHSMNINIGHWGEKNRIMAEKYRWEDTAKLTEKTYCRLFK